MKKFYNQLKNAVRHYIEPHSKPPEINLKANQIAATLKEAQTKQLALHAIYNNRSFTGDLVRYDKEKGKIVLKDFQKNVSVIIAIENIDRLNLVPPTIRQSQTQTPSQK